MARLGRGVPNRTLIVRNQAAGNVTVAVGQAVETDIALGRHYIAVGQATETDTARPVTIPVVALVGQAVETDTARPVTAEKAPVIRWKIQVDWDADGFMEDDEVTDRVTERGGVSMSYGRDQTRSLSPMAAGRAALELNNRSRDYSPDNLDSPLYGKVIQARPLRITAVLDDFALNSNPLFGSDISGWTPASASIAHSTSVVHPDGDGSMRITPSGGTACGAGSNLVAVSPGESYSANMWAYSAAGWDGVQTLINWYDSGTNFLFSDFGISMEVPAGMWVENGCTFIAPDNAAYGAVWAWQNGTPAVSDVWYVWNVTLELISGVSTLFNGFTDEFTVQPAQEDRSVAITGLDALAKLRGAKVTTPLYDGIQTGVAIGYVLDALGWPADKRDLDPGVTTVRWWWVEDGDAFEQIESLVQSEGPAAIVYTDIYGRIVFRDRHHRLFNDASRFSQTTFVDSTDAGEPAFTEMSYDHGWRDVVNSVTIKVDELGIAASPEVVWTDESITNIGASEVLTLRITLENPVKWPGATFDVIGGSASSSVTVDSGQTLTWTITAGAGGATIANLQVLAQPVTAHRSFTITKQDQDSINAYGLRSQDYTIPWAGVNDADAIADLILEASAQRRPIVELKCRSGTWLETERLRQQLARNLSDRVHIREPETCVDHDFFIEQIGHTVTGAGLMIETTFGLERAILQADDVFRFDDSDHGFDDGVFASVSLTDPTNLFRFDTSGQGFDDGVFAT